MWLHSRKAWGQQKTCLSWVSILGGGVRQRKSTRCFCWVMGFDVSSHIRTLGEKSVSTNTAWPPAFVQLLRVVSASPLEPSCFMLPSRAWHYSPKWPVSKTQQVFPRTWNLLLPTPRITGHHIFKEPQSRSRHQSAFIFSTRGGKSPLKKMMLILFKNGSFLQHPHLCAERERGWFVLQRTDTWVMRSERWWICTDPPHSRLDWSPLWPMAGICETAGRVRGAGWNC